MNCSLPECQTTAGCAHRGPKGELCWFPQKTAEIIDLRSPPIMRALLEAARKEKDRK